MNEQKKLDQPSAVDGNPPGMSVFAYGSVLLIGGYLGVLFTKSEIARWERVHKMFLFQEAHMYVIICVAIVVAMVSMAYIKHFGVTTIEGKPIKYEPKPYHKGVVIGGIMFGAGWAIAGACPGPIYAQIGAGEWMSILTLAGAMSGMFCYAALKPKLPH
ncbi:MAG: YeeE/YedE family protein [Planctomycetales bacterium]|nr:YeeE/YedE family protein [Planctomycetales bacterium]